MTTKYQTDKKTRHISINCFLCIDKPTYLSFSSEEKYAKKCLSSDDFSALTFSALFTKPWTL